MASETERQFLVGVAMMRDSGFRDWLMKDPYGAAESVGIRITEAEAKQVMDLSRDELEHAAKEVQNAVDPMRMMWQG